MRTEKSYRLSEIGKIGEAGEADLAPAGVPPLEYRQDLSPGDLARLMVEFPEQTAPLWAEVDQVLGPGWYLGRTETGESIEFGAEHAFGLSGPRFQMGVPWYDYLPGVPPPPPRKPASATPEAQKKKPWYEYLPSRGGASSQAEASARAEAAPERPSVYDVWGKKKGAPAEPIPPVRPAEQQEKHSFWDIFRRKPKPKSKVEVSPIPEAERRQAPEHGRFLRYSKPLPHESVQVEAEEAEEAEEPYEPPQPAQPTQRAIILPEVKATLYAPPEAFSRPPDNLFDVLAPEPTPPVLQPPKASLPGAMILGPASLPSQAGEIDVFSVLGPEPSRGAGLPAQAGYGPGYGPPAEATSPFEMIASPSEPTAFDILEPGPAEGGLVIRPEQGQMTVSSVFDVLEPDPQALRPYEPPSTQITSLFDTLEPEPPPYQAPPAYQPEAPPAPEAPGKRKAARKKSGKWTMPTREEWVRFISDRFNLDELWRYIRGERNSENFLEEQLNNDGATAPIETWSDALDWESIFEFFGVPQSVWGPYVDKVREEDERTGDSQEAWEEFDEKVLNPVVEGVADAFDSIMPKDIPGQVSIGTDDSSGTWGILYYEQLDPKKASKRQKEVLAVRQREDQERKELEHHLKVEVKRIWGPMPRPEDIVPWIEETFDVEAMFQSVQKERRTKPWKTELKTYGEGTMNLETVADLGPNRLKEYEYEVASYFGIPPAIVALYEDAASSQELWDDVFLPFFEVIKDAFSIMLPFFDLPGMIVINEDEEDHLAIQYVETVEQDE